MAVEIERKFLVRGTRWRVGTPRLCRQGYLCRTKERVVRVRIMGGKGFLNIKGVTTNASRLEFEYPIHKKDAEQLLNKLCEKPIIEKKRYRLTYAGFIWEVDEFLGENKGLVIAEIELKNEKQVFEKPDWVCEEVTNDAKYFNSNLVKNPFKKFKG